MSAQDGGNYLKVIARPMPDSIMLRWAPTRFETWDLGNRYGYKLIRYTILRDSSLVNEEPVVLAPNLKLLPLDDWEPLVTSSPFPGIAAQAIYGESFEVEAGQNLTPRGAYLRSTEQKQRFSFGLYAADLSVATARAMGLFYTDRAAKANEKYLYKVFLSLPDSLKHLGDTAMVFTGISAHKPLPVPFEFDVEFGDRMAMMSWNIFVHGRTYIAWEMERTGDMGKSFTRVKDAPIVPVSMADGKMPEYTQTADSLPMNDQKYGYRLRGITSFGEKGPWSDLIYGKGTSGIAATPHIESFNEEKGSVVLAWQFPAEAEPTIEGFKIGRSTTHSGEFKIIAEGLGPGERTFTDKKPLPSSYYKVIAYRDSAGTAESFPFLVQQVDSIPPARPVGLKGVADTLGIVKLEWDGNTEEDLVGYVLFKSVSGKDEYTRLNVHPVTGNGYSDTLSKQDLNRSVFYKIAALDHRYNQSVISKPVEIAKPDLIPPSNPVFKGFKQVENGVSLEWINSSSEDVKEYEIYRFEADSNQWKLISTEKHKNKGITTFTDEEVMAGIVTKYQILALDGAGNRSHPATSVDIKVTPRQEIAGISRLRAETDPVQGSLVLSWKTPGKKVKLYQVYREAGDMAYTLYKTVPGTENSFPDQKLKAGTRYAYRVKAVYEDGTVSGFSDEVKIEL